MEWFLTQKVILLPTSHTNFAKSHVEKYIHNNDDDNVSPTPPSHFCQLSIWFDSFYLLICSTIESKPNRKSIENMLIESTIDRVQ